MSKNKSPAFQFYPSDYLADANVAAMSLEAEGAYIRLLCYCWREGSLPEDIPALARLCRISPAKMRNLWPMLAPCFKSHGRGRLYHPRLRREKAAQVANRSAKSRAGRRGAKARWDKDLGSSAKVVPLAKRSSASASASSSSTTDRTPLPPALDTPRFQTTWDQWTAYRREIKKRLTPTTVDRQLKKLLKMGEDRAVAALEWSMENGWTGIFEPDQAKGAGAGGRSRRGIGTDDTRREQIAKLERSD